MPSTHTRYFAAYLHLYFGVLIYVDLTVGRCVCVFTFSVVNQRLSTRLRACHSWNHVSSCVYIGENNKYQNTRYRCNVTSVVAWWCTFACSPWLPVVKKTVFTCQPPAPTQYAKPALYYSIEDIIIGGCYCNLLVDGGNEIGAGSQQEVGQCYTIDLIKPI